MGKSYALIHPNRARREQGRIAEEREDHMQRQAAQQRVDLQTHVAQSFSTINHSAAEAAMQIEAWFQAEYASTEYKILQLDLEYVAAQDNLAQTLFNVSEDLKAGLLVKQQELHSQLVAREETVKQEYAPAMHNLELEHAGKQQLLQNQYKALVEDLCMKHENLKSELGCYLFSLYITRDTKLYETIQDQMQAQISLEEQRLAGELSIAKEISRASKENAQVYRDKIKHMKAIYLATNINAAVAVATGVAAYFIGGGAVASGFVAKSVQASLFATSIAAAEQAIKGSDKVGAKFNVNLAPQNSHRVSTSVPEQSSAPYTLSNMDTADSLAAIQRRFQQTATEVRTYNTAPNSSILNSTIRNQPAADLHNALVPYSRINASNYNFSFQINVRLVQDNGIRPVAWNIRFKQRDIPFVQQFINALDPNLTRNHNDGMIMAELKMYGRMAKNTRDSVVQVVSNPVAAARSTFILGADVIEAGLHFLGKDYYPAAQQRNAARVQAIKELLRADGLTQREAVGTVVMQALLFTPTRGMWVEAGSNVVVVARHAATRVRKFESPLTFQFEAGRLYSGFPIDAIKVRKKGVRPSTDRLQLEKLKTQYRQQASWINPVEIKDFELKKFVGELYRPNARMGSGSTADAVRIEINFANINVGNKNHLNKARNGVKYLEKRLKDSELSAHDRMIAENIRLDLMDSLGDKLWYSQTTTPNLS